MINTLNFSTQVFTKRNSNRKEPQVSQPDAMCIYAIIMQRMKRKNLMKNKEKKQSSLDYQDDVSIKDAYSPTKESLPERDKDVNI